MLLGGAKRLKSYSNSLNSSTLRYQSHYSSDLNKADSTLDIPKNALVIYGEDKRYFCLFKPIIDALERLKYPYSFYTSDEADPMLEHKSDIAEIKFIGKGTKAATILNTLQADICLLTTPQLDVLEIKRSKGVKHYCHILHSMGHIELYEIFALDYFDSVFTNSPIHTDFIREVEKVRGLKAKQVEIVGCPYLDYLHNKLDTLPQIQSSHTNTTILLAPSWGRESILEKYGLKLLKPLLDTGYNVIIRPHPQSYISQKNILDNLTQTLKSYNNLKWDNNADNIYSMAESDLMIGDFSGVLFDYICLFNKPLLTMEFTFNSIGYDLEDTSYNNNTWKDRALKDISQTIREQDFSNIKSIIDSALNDKSKLQNRLKYKELLWHFQKQGGMQTALKLLSIHKAILEEELGEFVEVHRVINAIESKINTTANSACSDFLGSASASSLQRTAGASHSSASHNPKNSSTILEFANENSSLGNHCIDLAFRHKARTPSPLTLCQNTKNSTSKTSNTRIFLNANDAESQSDSAKDSADSIESAKDSSHSTQGLKDSITSSHSIKSLKDSIDSAESFHDSNDSAESSNKIDCHESQSDSRNDDNGIDCHDSATQNLAMTDKGDSMESTKIISHAETCGLSRNDASLSSLRGDLSPKQSINENISAESRRIKRIESAESLKDSNDSIELNHKIDCHESQSDSRNDGNGIDCHDSATQNLAMTDKGDSAESRRNESVESFTKSQKESVKSQTQSHKNSSHSIKSLKDSIDSAESFHDSTNSTQSIKDSTTSSDSSFHIKDGHK